jgi:hypothetical protein
VHGAEFTVQGSGFEMHTARILLKTTALTARFSTKSSLENVIAAKRQSVMCTYFGFSDFIRMSAYGKHSG